MTLDRMRALPVIERVLIIGFLLFVILLLGFLGVWHLRYQAMERMIAGFCPRPGMPAVAAPVACTPDLAAATARWAGGLREEDLPNASDSEDRVTEISGRGDIELAPGLRSLHDLLARGVRFDVPLSGPGAVALPPRNEGRLEHVAPARRWSDATELYLYDDASDHLQNCVFGAAVQWGWDAREAATAPASLADLDALVDATSRPGDSSWLTLAFCIARIRDRAHVVAALLHTCPAATIRRWRERPYDPFAILLQEACRQRCDAAPADVVALFATGPISYVRANPDPSLIGACQEWWNIPARIAKTEDLQAEYEDAIITRTIAKRLPEMWKPMSGFVSPQEVSLPGDALDTLACHRFAVLAVDALAQRGDDGGFPDHLDLDLTAGPDRPPLRFLHDHQRLAISYAEDQTLPPYMKAALVFYRRSPDLNEFLEPLSVEADGVTIALDDPAWREFPGMAKPATAPDP